MSNKLQIDYVRTMKAVQMLGVSPNTFYKWVRQGKIKKHLFNGITYYSISEINEAIKNS